MSYLEHYGLKKEPFSNAPVSQFYFNSAPHASALQRLTYAVENTKGLAILVGHGQPTDVEALQPVGRLRVAIDAPEHERRVAQVEVGQPLDQCLVERIPFEPSLERAAEVGLGHGPHTPSRLTTGDQAVVRVIDVCLLCGDIRVLLGHIWTRQCYR
jgi:hypothetical protein